MAFLQLPSHADIIHLCEDIALSTKESVAERRLQMFNEINGDIFYQLSRWPFNLQQTFWRKPICDQGTFKLICFLIGNGCDPLITCEWILTSQKWTNYQSLRRRSFQISWIFEHLQSRQNTWFYYDLHHSLYLYLDGSYRNN